MDGNGRWATARGLPRLHGHKEGVRAVKELVRECPSLGVDTITLFAFAIANWKRDKEEVDGLWALFKIFIEKDLSELVQNGVRVIVIGNRSGLPPSIADSIKTVELQSKDNSEFLLQVALNYDGVEEVARLLQRTIAEGISVEKIDAAYIRTNLDTQADNEPDIVVRTGMQSSEEGMSIWRSSAFLPIQSAQSVCVSSEVLWPDFTVEDLRKIIVYADPDARLFGGQRSIVTSETTA